MKLEQIVSSETSAIRIQTPGNYPKRNKLYIYIYSQTGNTDPTAAQNNHLIRIRKFNILKSHDSLSSGNLLHALFACGETVENIAGCLYGTIRTVHTTHAAALKTTTHPKTRCRKPYAATQHLMLLLMGVCTRNMSS